MVNAVIREGYLQSRSSADLSDISKDLRVAKSCDANSRSMTHLRHKYPDSLKVEMAIPPFGFTINATASSY